MVDFPVPVSEHVMQVIIRLLILIMCIFVLRLWYLNSRGYAAFGVTDTSFREGLLHSLRKLNLPYEETFSGVKLPTLGADLQVNIQSWAGTAELKVKERQFGTVLSDLVKEMNEYYQSSVGSQVNLHCCFFFTVVGVVFAMIGVFLIGEGKIF